MSGPSIPKKSKKLYRSRTDRKLAGVCGGIGAYFEVDPVLIRLLWIVFTLAGGGGVVAYLIAWLIVPEEPAAA
jgi:phage shock protein C